MLQCKEIVFVPNAPLCLAPFPALLDSNKNYLCESFRIRVIPSLSSLAMIEDCPADYHNNCGALLIGDLWVQDVVYHGHLLTMKEVLSADIRARLVVLSCCHSGRGEIKAEGVVGIARAFLGAGARSVLVSLWAVDDEATLKFMESFYHHLMQQRSASEALNRAMRCMRESDEFHEVKYWAPFVLIGDDVTLDLTGNEEMH